jgi:hypothetical protein
VVRRWFGFFSVAIGLFLTAGVVLGDVEPAPCKSHIPIPAGGKGDLKQLFQDRLRQFNDRAEDLQKLRQMLPGQDLEKVLRKLKEANIDPSDPRIADLAKQFAPKAGGSKIEFTPDEIERLRKLFQNAFPKEKQTAELPSSNPTPGPTPPPKIPDSKDPAPKPAPPRVPLQIDPVNDAERAEATEQIMQLARKFEKWSDVLDNSPALQDALRDVARWMKDQDSMSAEERIDTQLALLNRMSRESGDWLKDSFKSLGKLDLPNLPRINTPSPNISRLPSFSAPHRLPTLSPGSVSWKPLLLIGIVVLTLIIVWKMLAQRTWAKTAAGKSTWKLGPWPMDPSQIASRADLVKMFEHLSLLRLGQDAQSWNHLAIASQLGGTAEERRQAADALARVYEQARYAPGDEPLSADSLAAARHDLSLLAGVAAA